MNDAILDGCHVQELLSLMWVVLNETPLLIFLGLRQC